MLIGDEREIVHLSIGDGWVIVLSVYLWIWLSLTVTIVAVREQIRRRRWERPERPDNHIFEEEEDAERYDLIKEDW